VSAGNQIRVLIAVLVIVAVVWAIGVVLMLRAISDVPTKLGAVGDWLAGGAFLLALLAAVVASLAYGFHCLNRTCERR
jgi:hypothetical protein